MTGSSWFSTVSFEISEALSSPARCSHGTVLLVDRLLDVEVRNACTVRVDDSAAPNDDNDGGRKAAGRRAAKADGLPLSAKSVSKTAQKQRPPPKVKISKEIARPVTVTERRRLATTIINIALESLSKSTNGQSHTGSRDKTIPTQSAIMLKPSRKVVGTSQQGTQAKATKCLQEKSVNQMSPSKRDKLTSKIPTQPSIRTEDGELMVAQCCHHAFSYLCTSLTNAQDWQLESGMTAFISKILNLGYIGLATQALDCLRQRLRTRLRDTFSSIPRPTDQVSNANSRSAISVHPEGSAGLFIFKSAIDNVATLSIVITFQLLALRISKANSTEILATDLTALVEDSGPSSLCQMILKRFELTNDGKTATLQLETFANHLGGLCPSISSTHDTHAARFVGATTPDLAFRAQTAAIRCRLLSMRLAKCTMSADEEILKPFVKCLAAYARRSKDSLEFQYSLASAMFESLEATTTHNLNAESSKIAFDTNTSPNMERIEAQLAKLRKQAGVEDDTRVPSSLPQFCKDFSSPRDGQCCLMLSQAAVAQLRQESSSNSNTDKSFTSLSTALSIYEYVCTSESYNDNSAIRAALELRNAALRYLKTTSSLFEDVADQARSAQQRVCRQIVNACLHFLLRVLNTNKIGKGRSKEATLDQGIGSASSLSLLHAAVPSFKFVISYCNYFRHKPLEETSWTHMHRNLGACRGLLEMQLIEAPEDEKLQGWSCDISNAYFGLYLAGKSSLPDCALQSLKYSCCSLEYASVAQKREGILSLKLFKLAQLYRELAQSHDATKACHSVVEESLKLGAVLQEIDELKTPEAALGEVTSCSREFQLVVEALRMSLQTALRQPALSSSPTDGSLYDSASLNVSQRAFLLGLQLELLAQTKIARSEFEQKSLMQQRLSRSLLDVCEQEVPSRPLLLLRACHQILQFPVASFSDTSDDGPEYRRVQDLVRTSCKTLTTIHTKDDAEHFTGFAISHVRASCIVGLALRDLSGYRHELVEALEFWHRTIDGASAIEKLELNSYELSAWKSQLSELANFLGLAGLPYQQLSVLHLKHKIYSGGNVSAGFSLEDSMIASLDLSTHLLYLGHLEQSWIYLKQAQQERDQSEIEPQTAVRYSLAFADYFLEIGNLDQCRIHLNQVTIHFQQGMSNVNVTHARDTKSTSPLTVEILVADHHFIQSRCNFLSGNFTNAMLAGKECLSCLQRAWTRHGMPAPSVAMRSTETTQSAQDKDVDTMNKLNIAFKSITITSADPSDPGLHNDENNNPDSKNPISQQPQLSSQSAPLLLSRLCRAFSNLAQLTSSSALLFAESLHYLSQARAIAEQAKASSLLCNVLLSESDINCQGNKVSESTRQLSLIASMLEKLEESKLCIIKDLAFASLHRKEHNWQDEKEDYERAERQLARLSQSFELHSLVSSRSRELPNESVNVHKNHGLKSQKFDTQTSSSRAIGKSSRTAHMCQDGRPPQKSSKKECKSVHPVQFKATFNMLMLTKAEAMLMQRDLESCHDILDKISKQDGADVNALQQIIQSELHLQEALKLLSNHAVYSMLVESTLSLPSGKCVSKFRDTATSLVVKTPKRHNKSTNFRGLAMADTDKLEFVETSNLFDKTLHSIMSVLEAKYGFPSIGKLEQAISILASAAIFRSYFEHEQHHAISEQHHFALMTMGRYLDLPKSVAASNSRSLVLVDRWRKTMQSHRSLSQPQFRPGAFENATTDPLRSFAQLHTEMHESLQTRLPKSWDIISLYLDQTQEHLLLMKNRYGQDPFVIRLPLARQNEEAEEEEKFTFSEAVVELRDIIARSDATVHAARDAAHKLRVKGAKGQWWSDREELDTRLHNLLINIENVWFGGFRGILSQEEHHEAQIARFEKVFEAILDKHLPSRRRGTQHAVNNNPLKVKLDRFVFELFVSLLDDCSMALDELDTNMEETLTDLLYYVIDILQFNGEANAYDEIDFDSIIVELHSAIRNYHEDIRKGHSRTENLENGSRHTILVLDKHLHCFPWESLPCLEGKSVSRVQSLVDLQERLAIIEAQTGSRITSSFSSSGISISPRNGTYILNPSGDLKRTQERFENPLTPLTRASSGWSSIIGRPPREDEFIQALLPRRDGTDAEGSPMSNRHNEGARMLIYFGHGSGAQYVRHRQIKALRYSHLNAEPSFEPASMHPSLSAVLLFGCSSASLLLHGEFEPHGTPLTYLTAGVPSLLGSLWDVTDGDIDKFAGGVLERWGLIESGSASTQSSRTPVKQSKTQDRMPNKTLDNRTEKRKNTNQKPTIETTGNLGRTSLTEAVAKSRGDCYLKYLNGAAMVVYGIPTFLRD